MRISDWSSDVCSSDLGAVARSVAEQRRHRDAAGPGGAAGDGADEALGHAHCLGGGAAAGRNRRHAGGAGGARGGAGKAVALHPLALVRAAIWRRGVHRPRSEEHTSELQSLMRISYAVFCLKKKNTKT